jgi:two-component system, NtrC family, nitrogen regulation sensor histidine kinase NtrY
MNSVTPIHSLSTAAYDLLQDAQENSTNLKKIEQSDFEDIYNSIRSIKGKSESLLNFVKSYKNLTRIPQPNFDKVFVCDLFNNVASLFRSELSKMNIELTIGLQYPQLYIFADRDLIERVLDNLILNSIEALHEVINPKIKLSSFQSKNNVIIEVKDNGKGISGENLGKIFIPFFTTKEKGSGIGLSLSMQIMRLHGGSITAHSNQGVETSFILCF